MPLDTLAGIAAMLARVYRMHKPAHFGEHAPHVGHHILTIQHHLTITTIAQCCMEYCPTLGIVDLLTHEHLLDPLRHLLLSRQLKQQFQRLVGYPVF